MFSFSCLSSTVIGEQDRFAKTPSKSILPASAQARQAEPKKI
jgi:hypothetical protein